MFDFIFLIDWLIVLKIIGVDLILGLDNAIVIALACAGLAESVRNKAVLLGTGGAIIARVAFLFVGFTLLSITGVKLLAGAYLVYLAYSLLNGTEDDDPNIAAKTSMWGAVGTIVLADIMMSLDNVVAIAGAASDNAHGFWYSVFGIALAIPIIVLASKFLLKMLDKFPVIMWAGSALIAYIGAELLLKEAFIKSAIDGIGLGINHLDSIIGLIAACVIMLISYFGKSKQEKILQS